MLKRMSGVEFSKGGLELDRPVTVLRGVGPERATQLARLGVRTISDLLLLRPRRYEDRRNVRAIAHLALNESATARGRVVAAGIKRYQKGAKSLFELILDDGTGRLHCRWWNMPYMEQYFRQGDEVLVFGKVKSLRPRTIDHPETEVIEGGEDVSIHLNRVVPIYPLTEGLPQRWLRGLIWRTLHAVGDRIPEPWPPEVAPDFLTRRRAVHQLHVPNELPEAETARARLALDEFVAMQANLFVRRQKLMANARGYPCGGDNRLIKPFLSRLGFRLTAAQTRVLKELRRDLSAGAPMRRLLQGDVGSGKTVVAACCALMTLESGFNVALMAPTEILAEQHFQTFRRWLEPLGIVVQLRTAAHRLTTSTDAAPSRAVAPGSRLALVIGTHALIEEAFALERLGLVIIDEQHKFGVAQREKLVRKGEYPHLLVMTATPIPRTLALTLYGDLDVSVIDELPPGRAPIKTFIRGAERLPKVWAFVRTQLAQGRQAYIVYPRIDETGDSNLKAVTKEWQTICQKLAPHPVGLLHGRLSTEEKDKTMGAFRAKQLDALVATSVIEVGLDVPNATVMVIENAEQFGLAQLHQLRGRIGRGAHESYCILIPAKRTPEVQRRLQVLAQTEDGFRIAEADLQLRGPGDLLGRDQSGMPPLIFGDLAADATLVPRAKEIVTKLAEIAARDLPA